MFLPKSPNLSGSKTIGLETFLGFSFNCQVMLANKFTVIIIIVIIICTLSVPKKCTGEHRDLIRVHRFVTA